MNEGWDRARVRGRDTQWIVAPSGTELWAAADATDAGPCWGIPIFFRTRACKSSAGHTVLLPWARISLQKNALASLKACSTSCVFQLTLRVSGFRSRTSVMISQLRHPQWRNLANASFLGIDVPAGRFC